MSGSDARPTYSIVGDRYVFLATGRETSGACFAFEALVGPGGGPPPHVHRREDELFYIIEGEFDFVVDGVTHRRTAGGSLLAGRGTLHSFRNVGTVAGKMIIMATPAGLEDYFMEIGVELDGPTSEPVPPTQDDIERLVAAAPRYGLTISGGPA